MGIFLLFCMSRRTEHETQLDKWDFIFSNPLFSPWGKMVSTMSGSLKNNVTRWCRPSMPRAANANNSNECCINTVQIYWQWKDRDYPGQQKVLLLHYSDSSQDQHKHSLKLHGKHTHLHCQEPRVCHLVSSWSLYVQAVCAVERRHNYCHRLLNLSHVHLTEQDWQLDRVAIKSEKWKSQKRVHCSL